MPFAAAFARSMEHDFLGRILMEDFLQAALIGIWEAIESKFDPERGAKFSTASWFRMRKRCLELAATRHAVKAPRGVRIRTVSFETPIGSDQDESPSFEDLLATTEIGPEYSVAIGRSWAIVLRTMADAIDALDDLDRAAVIRRNLRDSDMARSMRDPEIRPHRVTLWKRESVAMSRVFGLMTAAVSVDEVVLTLRLIHECRGRNGFDERFESTRAS